jgi:hypothetical protein
MKAIHRSLSSLRRHAAGVIAVLLSLAAPGVRGADTLLPEPNLSVRAMAQVDAAALQSDGKLLIGGLFTQVNGQSRTYLARLNVDGSLDSGFVHALTDRVTRIVIAGNYIYIAGYSDSIDGQPRAGLARFSLATGVLDGWTMDANGTVEALDSDGTYLYVGGEFTVIGGQPRLGLARIVLNTGALDPAWAPAMSSNFERPRTFAFSAGYVYVGGLFSKVNGQPRTNLARLSSGSGAVDPVFNPAPDGMVMALVAQGGNLYVGGWQMNHIGGTTTQGLAKVDAVTGAVDPVFRPPLYPYVYAVISDGTSLLVGGSFPRADLPASWTGVARIDGASGTVTAWGEPGWTGAVSALAQGSGKLYATGYFEGIGGVFTRSIARLNPTTLSRDPVDMGATDEGKVLALVPLGDGRVVMGGRFNEVNGKPHANLALLGADGSVSHGWTVGADGAVYALATDGAYVYVGGEQGWIGNEYVGRLGRIALATLQVDRSFAPEPNNRVVALALNGDYLYAGGTFTAVGELAKSRLARVALANGAVDAAWSPDPDGIVYALLPVGADVIAGGAFANIGGLSRTAVAKVSGSSGVAIPTFNSSVSSASGTSIVWSLAASGSALYIGGGFEKVGGVTHYGIARVDSGTGQPSAAFTALLSGAAYALAATPSALYAGYTGTLVNGKPQVAAAKLDLTTGALDSTLPGAGLTGNQSNVQVYAIAVTSGKVWFGGWFDQFAGQPRGGVAAWGALTPQAVTVFEFFAPSLNHYFRTAIAEEAAALTANPALGFLPTGNDFRAYLRSTYPADANPVCRFYGSVTPGPNSHFYTAEAAECTAVKNLQFTQPTTQPRWNFEEIAFAINLPTSPGVCPGGAPVKVYRAYNNRALQGDSNHRYTTDVGAYNQLVANNWIGEGVVMCALQ